VCVFQTGLGWGNRVAPIFTAAIIALLTNRVLLVRASKEGVAWSDAVPVWEYLEPQVWRRLLIFSLSMISALGPP
jgi:hypothetical protein